MMSIRIPKAGSGTLGILVLLTGILFISAGAIDRNPQAAQYLKTPTPTPTATPMPGVTILGGRFTAGEGVIINSEILLTPLRLSSPLGEITQYPGIRMIEIFGGDQLSDSFRGIPIIRMEVLQEWTRQTRQSIRIVFSLDTQDTVYSIGLGSILPIGTIIDSDSRIELSIRPEGISAQILPAENMESVTSPNPIIPSNEFINQILSAEKTPVPSIEPTDFINPIIDIGIQTYYDQLVLAQGAGGETIVNIRNFDPNIAPLTSVRQSLSGAAGKFEEKIGGGMGRETYISTGDLDNDGSPDIVLSFGPITREAVFPNIVVVRNADTRQVIGNSFVAFPSGSGSDVNYNGGEIRTAVGDFIGSGTPQIACAQGRGGNGLVRLYQYTGKPAPLAWEVVGQFSGLPSNLVVQGEKNSERIGLTLAAGDLDNDGLDELIVGQANGPKSQTIFHVLDINAKGGIQGRYPYAGFRTLYRGNGGIELFTGDLNGDGWREIIVGSLGNLKNFGDARDTVPLSLVGIIHPVVKNNQITGFVRPGGRSVFNAFSEAVNPSGAISVVAGEFDGNPANGKEIVVGTGAFTETSGLEYRFQKAAPQARYRFFKLEYEGDKITNINSWIGSGDGFIGFLDRANPTSGAIHLGVIERGPLKPISPNPPTTLALGDFTLAVEKYDTYQWTSAFSTVTNASGTAWTEFNCSDFLIIGEILGIANLLPVTLQVVEIVSNPQTQISLQEALEFDSSLKTGQNLILLLPKEEFTRTKPLIARELANKWKFDESLLGLLASKEGKIKVYFSGCTINVDSTDSKKGTIVTGKACYPTKDPYPKRIEVKKSGFTTWLDSLCITPASATAEAELEFPNHLSQGANCQAASVDLGEITITQDCQYYKVVSDQGFGPWAVCNTGMEIEGIGFVADFSKTQSWPSLPSLAASWMGVVLMNGETVPGDPNATISNSGYVKAPYAFSNALVTVSGLTAEFSLIDGFSFQSLQPIDYTIFLKSGGISMNNCQITGGSFSNGQILLPRAAVLDPGNNPIKADYATLKVQDDMDLYSDSLAISQEFVWGELSRTYPNQICYKASKPQEGHFYLSASLRPAFWPLDAGGFRSPYFYGVVADQLEAQGIQGLTAFNLLKLEAITPDTPGKKSILFDYTDRSWMIVGGKGVHALFQIENFRTPIDLGPTHETYYEGKNFEGKNVPFQTFLKINYKQERMAEFQFVDSALYDNDLNGHVFLDSPTKADVPFEDMKFTSTAEIAGARIVLSTPVPLDYWGVDLVQNPYQSTAGVMCVKTGQIFLTGSGIAEKRHFAQPFWLTWGEILSSGQLDELHFDYNSSGQMFDGFPFVAGGIGLSPWTPADNTDKKNAYLQAGGDVYFDFFGGLYSNIKDYNYKNKPNSPFNGRRIEMSTDTAFGTKPNETNIARMWGNSFGAFDYNTRYDDADQDGYVGNGIIQMFDLIEGPLASSIVLSSTRICMQVYSATEEERHDFTVGPVAHFGQMTRITGCACVANGQVERVHLSAELEKSKNYNIALRSASYSNLEFDLTPSTWDLWIYGNMFMSLLVGSDVEVTGEAHFAVNRDDAYVEGEIEGSIETNSLFGGGLRADGRLEWHLGAPVSGDSYQSLQGRLAVEVVSSIGSSANEGGFYIGLNAPKDRAWVLADAGGRFSLNPNLLPDRLTGIYGYVRQSASVNLYIVSGGYEVYVGLGAFLDVGTNSPLEGAATLVTGLPDVVGNLGVRIWGEILGGLVSASAYANLQVLIGLPPGFEGSVGLEACVLWVICGSVDVHCGLNKTDGFYIY